MKITNQLFQPCILCINNILVVESFYNHSIGIVSFEFNRSFNIHHQNVETKREKEKKAKSNQMISVRSDLLQSINFFELILWNYTIQILN